MITTATDIAFTGLVGALYALVRCLTSCSLPRQLLTFPASAGAGAYYFAKKSINADRRTKLEEHRMKRQAIQSMEYSDNVPSRPMSAATMGGTHSGSGHGVPATTDSAGSPSQEAGVEPAPTRHAPTTEAERVFEKGKYESKQPYRSPKGDRFS